MSLTNRLYQPPEKNSSNTENRLNFNWAKKSRWLKEVVELSQFSLEIRVENSKIEKRGREAEAPYPKVSRSFKEVESLANP